MSTLSFNKQQLIEALEARRPWAEQYDAKRLAQHQRDEKAYLLRFRDACRKSIEAHKMALKWDYPTVKQRAKTNRYNAKPQVGGTAGAFQIVRDRDSDNYGRLPVCPQSMVAKLDRVLNNVRVTRQNRFAPGPTGSWSDAYDVLTRDDSIEPELC